MPQRATLCDSGAAQPVLSGTSAASVPNSRQNPLYGGSGGQQQGAGTRFSYAPSNISNYSVSTTASRDSSNLNANSAVLTSGIPLSVQASKQDQQMPFQSPAAMATAAQMYPKAADDPTNDGSGGPAQARWDITLASSPFGLPNALTTIEETAISSTPPGNSPAARLREAGSQSKAVTMEHDPLMQLLPQHFGNGEMRDLELKQPGVTTSHINARSSKADSSRPMSPYNGSSRCVSDWSAAPLLYYSADLLATFASLTFL